MFPCNPLILIAPNLGLLIGGAYAVSKAAEVMPAWGVVLCILGALLAMAAFAFLGCHALDAQSRYEPRFVVRGNDGRRLRETNWAFVAWWVWLRHRSEGSAAFDRDGIEYPDGSWIQKGAPSHLLRARARRRLRLVVSNEPPAAIGDQ